MILQDGMRRMLEAQEDVFYYVTVMNENYAQPPLPAGSEEGIRRGMSLLRASALPADRARVQLAGSATIRAWVPGHYVTLGTDGYGRSDTRAALRAHFGVDRARICAAARAAMSEVASTEK